jgi:hypothetical protein
LSTDGREDAPPTRPEFTRDTVSEEPDPEDVSDGEESTEEADASDGETESPEPEFQVHTD